MKTHLFVFCALVVLALALLVWLSYANTHALVTPYTVSSPDLPAAFDGYTIAHISDLHNDELTRGNRQLLDLLRQAAPDVIVFTGDIIDSRLTNADVAVDFAQEAAQIAPVYYALGNHELRKDKAFLQDYLTRMEQAGVTILRGDTILLQKDNASIALTGIQRKIPDAPPDTFSLLLAHHPERIDDYAAAGYDLVLSGHAHGGQFRLPYLGGLFAPGQGFFPRYTAGLHAQGNTQMLISRGLGGYAFPPRLNNRPELPVITLRTK